MKNCTVLILTIVVLADCKKSYNPPATSAPQSYLVVEGIINSGGDSTFIKLSRTVNISTKTIKIETKAKVSVEGDQNNSYPLTETTPGVYAAPGLNLDITHKYRLRIVTSDNKQYLSDYEVVKNTPPIDSIGYALTKTGIQVYTNTRDATANSKYYRWDYSETWQFHAKYESFFEVVDGAIVARKKQVYTCFSSDSSSNIVLGSSADLKQDLIYQAPITTVSATSEKLEDKYSIFLHEYVLTPDAYDFYTNLKKNTEQLGSIFDAQPSQISGDIHCISNPTEPVVGYVSITNVQSKRVFISNDQLPNNFIAAYPYDCEQDTTLYFNPKTKNNEVQDFIIDAPPGIIDITLPIYGGGVVIGYFRSTPICADCTLRGTPIQLPFWK